MFKHYKRTDDIVEIPEFREPQISALKHVVKTLASQRQRHDSIRGLSKAGIESALLAGRVLETTHARFARSMALLS